MKRQLDHLQKPLSFSKYAHVQIWQTFKNHPFKENFSQITPVVYLMNFQFDARVYKNKTTIIRQRNEFPTRYHVLLL